VEDDCVRLDLLEVNELDSESSEDDEGSLGDDMMPESSADFAT